MSTRLGASCVITANNEQQLKSRTMAELGFWHTMALNGHWFERQAMTLKPAPWYEELLKKQLKLDTAYYYAQAQLWSEENPDAFAGLHNHKGVMLLFDEASGIPPAIWSVSQGFFTEKTLDRYWFAFSNPRRNTGTFFECFHRYRDEWYNENIDSRTVEENDKAVYDSIIRTYGEDSDEARVEVYGQFPRQGDSQFISRELVDLAATRDVFDDTNAALVLGVDVARFGDDESVAFFRQGRNARLLPIFRWKNMDLVYSANKVCELIEKYNPDAVCIDGDGLGGGLVDIIKSRGYRVHDIQFGSRPDDDRFANKRTEIWSRLKDWLGTGAIPDDKGLTDDLVGPNYSFEAGSDKVALEPKVKMKKRGLHSPDAADALALTLAVQVARRDRNTSRFFIKRRTAADVDYSLFS